MNAKRTQETKKILGDIGLKMLGMLRVAAEGGSTFGSAAEDMLANLAFEAYKRGFEDGQTK